VDFDEPSFNELTLPDIRKTGFQVLDYSVYVEGLCAGCKRNKEKKTPHLRGR
jgi:hypothetical protein